MLPRFWRNRILSASLRKRTRALHPLGEIYPRWDLLSLLCRSLRAQAMLVVALLLFVVALLPRVLGLNDFFTIDEPYHWMPRVQAFRAALLAGDWAATNQVGHPGVTTMWLGALGDWLASRHGLAAPDPTAYSVSYLAMLRLPLVLVNSICVALGYLLLRRLLRPFTAVLAGLLWATSPFLIGLSRVLHLDALVASFVTLSALLLLVATTRRLPIPNSRFPIPNSQYPSATPWLAVLGSGFFAGLALLTKSSAFVFMPWALALLVAHGWRATRARGAHLRHLLTRTSRLPLLWLGTAALIFVVLWPAMWVTPLKAVGAIVTEVVENGGQPHDGGNYFLGQPVEDPGWSFYLAVVLWRSSPTLLFGLLLLPLIVLRGRDERRPALWLLALALWFGLVLSLPPKKFDRYLLPIWPLLEIIAAISLATLLRQIMLAARQRWRARWLGRPGAAPALATLLAAALLAQDALHHPYYLAYFNPLLGGGPPGAQVLLAGWGEGNDQVGAWLQQRPDVKRGLVMASNPLVLQPFLPDAHVVDIRDPHYYKNANYAVLYVRNVARLDAPKVYALIRETAPLTTVQINGITYATIYQLPRTYDTPVKAVFGQGLRLQGYSQTLKRRVLTLSTAWSVERDQPGGALCFIHVLAPDNRTVAQIDVPVDSSQFPSWQQGQQFGDTYTIKLPDDLPKGSYRVAIGVYRQPSGERLPLINQPTLPLKAAGPEALLLTTVQIK